MLGEGLMSSVVHCVCTRSGAHAAIKMYHKDRMNSMNVKQASRGLERTAATQGCDTFRTERGPPPCQPQPPCAAPLAPFFR